MDEAVQLCNAVASGNFNTLCFFLLPQYHSSTHKTTIIKNRRLLEDKVVGCLGFRIECYGFEAARCVGDRPELHGPRPSRRSQEEVAAVLFGLKCIAFQTSF